MSRPHVWHAVCAIRNTGGLAKASAPKRTAPCGGISVPADAASGPPRNPQNDAAVAGGAVKLLEERWSGMPTHEARVFVAAPLPEVFDFLSNVANVPLFAPGIDDAVLVGGAQGLQGASVGLRTRAGRELRAQITHFHQDESWTVVDERSTVLQVQVEPERGGTMVVAQLSGNWRPIQERTVVAEWEKLMQELPKRVAPAAVAAR